MDIISLGLDTETNQGPPMTFQCFSPPDKLNISDVFYHNPETASERFLEYLEKILGRESAIGWAHNYHFDLPSIFWNRKHEFLNERFNFDVGNWNVRGVKVQHGAVFCNLRRGRQRVYLRDTGRFYMGRLAKVGELVRPDLPKLSMPEGLGERTFGLDEPGFRDYALRDAELAYWIGIEVLKWHDHFDVPLGVSSADYSGKVFRRKFLPEGGLRFPSKGGVSGAYLAYHGGKNVYPARVPKSYPKVYSLDIRSAYPYAMTKLPDFLAESRYKRETRNVVSLAGESLELWGIYKISGRVKPCKWPVLYGPHMKRIDGEFRDLWVAGPELVEAVRSGELLELSSCHGFRYIDDPSARHPFREFAEFFYNARTNASSLIEKETYKIILNSLSGKLAEVRRDKEAPSCYTDAGLDYAPITGTPGPLFHPIIAALITSYIRAIIHGYEHKYEAVHTSTDGFFTEHEPDPADLADRLGSLKLEAVGKLDVLRNKLYVLRDDRGVVLKVAKHGFRGTVDQLIRCIDTGEREYDYIRCNSLKDSFKTGKTVNKFQQYHAKIDVEDGRLCELL